MVLGDRSSRLILDCMIHHNVRGWVLLDEEQHFAHGKRLINLKARKFEVGLRPGNSRAK